MLVTVPTAGALQLVCGEWQDERLCTLLKILYLVISMPSTKSHFQARLAMGLGGALWERLSAAAPAAAYERQLAAVQEGRPPEERLTLAHCRQLCLRYRAEAASRVASLSAEAAAAPLPTAIELRELAGCSVPLEALGPTSIAGVLDLEWSCCQQLVALCGDEHPPWACTAGILGLVHMPLPACQQLLRRAVQLAEAANRPFWLARAGYWVMQCDALCMMVGLPAFSLETLRELKTKVRVWGGSGGAPARIPGGCSSCKLLLKLPERLRDPVFCPGPWPLHPAPTFTGRQSVPPLPGLPTAPGVDQPGRHPRGCIHAPADRWRRPPIQRACPGATGAGRRVCRECQEACSCRQARCLWTRRWRAPACLPHEPAQPSSSACAACSQGNLHLPVAMRETIVRSTLCHNAATEQAGLGAHAHALGAVTGNAARLSSPGRGPVIGCLPCLSQSGTLPCNPLRPAVLLCPAFIP